MNGRILITAAAVTALTGCGGTAVAHPQVTHHPASVTAATPDSRFMAAVAAAGLGSKDTASPAVLTVGRQACRLWPLGLGPGTYQRLVRILARRTGASTYQAQVLVGAAIRDLCPWAKQFLPPGAP